MDNPPCHLPSPGRPQLSVLTRELGLRADDRAGLLVKAIEREPYAALALTDEPLEASPQDGVRFSTMGANAMKRTEDKGPLAGPGHRGDRLRDQGLRVSLPTDLYLRPTDGAVGDMWLPGANSSDQNKDGMGSQGNVVAVGSRQGSSLELRGPLSPVAGGHCKLSPSPARSRAHSWLSEHSPHHVC